MLALYPIGLHQMTNQRALQSKLGILTPGLAGPRQQNLISISDVLDLKSVQKQLFSCYNNYGLEI